MKEIIPTNYSQLFFTIKVDDADFESLNNFKWTLYKNRHLWYARLRISQELSRHLNIEHDIPMHRLLMGLKHGDKRMVDHRDRDGLNNQKQNLRFCTHRENKINSKNNFSSSPYKGVTLMKNAKVKKWLARIDNRHIGNFLTPEEAALAFNAEAINLHGEFAFLNII